MSSIREFISSSFRTDLHAHIASATATFITTILGWAFDFFTRCFVGLIVGVGTFYIIKLITLISTTAKKNEKTSIRNETTSIINSETSKINSENAKNDQDHHS